MDLRDVTKIRILRREDYPGLSTWALNILLRVLITRRQIIVNRRRCDHRSRRSEYCKEGTTGQGMWQKDNETFSS